MRKLLCNADHVITISYGIHGVHFIEHECYSEYLIKAVINCFLMFIYIITTKEGSCSLVSVFGSCT